MQEFIDAMRSAGVGPDNPADIVADDTIRRYQVEGDKPRSKNGVYCVKFDSEGFGVGWYMSHKAGEVHSWHTKAKRDISPEERAEHKRKIDAARRERKAAIAKQHEEAADKASEIWRASDRAGSNAYLDRKRIGLNGARTYKGMVAVPMYKDAKLIGLQFIGDDGAKRFLTGVDKTGSYHSMRGPDMSVIRICEGFATGAALRDCWPDNPVIVAWDAANLKPVARAMAVKYPDARIVICGDNDQWTTDQKGKPWNPGYEKAHQAAASIGGAQVFLPPFHDDDADKRTDWWDYWDAFGADGVRDAMVDVAPEPEIVETPLDGGDVFEDDGGQAPQHLTHIRPLGHDGGDKYLFFPNGKGTIVSKTSSQLANIAHLLELDPNRNFWEMHFDVDGKGSSRAMAEFAAGTLMDICHKMGVFRVDAKRGIGAWEDDCGYIVNTGKRVIGKGVDVPTSDFKGSHVYVSDVAVVDMSVDPLTPDMARALLDLCCSLTWKRAEYGKLAAGWIVVAGIGGALSWRPHIWLTGPSGSGKSTVMDKIIKACLRGVAVIFDGGTSEAGVRKYLGSSSRPFIMDEAESESLRDRAEMDKIVGLFRKASSGGVIANANATFNAQSCACFAAINPNVKEVADQARITLLELDKDRSPGRRENYARILEDIHRLIVPGFNHALFKFAFDNIETLTHNIGAFNAAASAMFGNPRTADQLAPMIAGAYILHSQDKVTVDQARAFIGEDDWAWFTAIGEENDSSKLVAHIMTSRISYDVMGARREGAIGDLVDQVINGADGALDIHRGLKTYGIKVDQDWVHIANGSSNLSRLLRDTPWVPWARTLGDYPGSGNNGNKTVYFMKGVTSKVTSIPIDALRDVTEPVEVEIDAWDGEDFG